MTLGERINNYRTAKNLSQTELAEQLDVSRQSVSKWETDASVPDLDKLVKLCDLFEVSMDELVRGEKTEGEGSVHPRLKAWNAGLRLTPRMIVGVLLIALGILGGVVLLHVTGFLINLVYGIPFVVFGIICIAVKRNLILWLGWALVCMFALIEANPFLQGPFWTMNIYAQNDATGVVDFDLNWPAFLAVLIPFVAGMIIVTILVRRKGRKNHETTL